MLAQSGSRTYPQTCQASSTGYEQPWRLGSSWALSWDRKDSSGPPCIPITLDLTHLLVMSPDETPCLCLSRALLLFCNGIILLPRTGRNTQVCPGAHSSGSQNPIC